jgi:hypothetical protein
VKEGYALRDETCPSRGFVGERSDSANGSAFSGSPCTVLGLSDRLQRSRRGVRFRLFRAPDLAVPPSGLAAHLATCHGSPGVIPTTCTHMPASATSLKSRRLGEEGRTIRQGRLSGCTRSTAHHLRRSVVDPPGTGLLSERDATPQSVGHFENLKACLSDRESQQSPQWLKHDGHLPGCHGTCWEWLKTERRRCYSQPSNASGHVCISTACFILRTSRLLLSSMICEIGSFNCHVCHCFAGTP